VFHVVLHKAASFRAGLITAKKCAEREKQAPITVPPPDAFDKVLAALSNLGFRQRDAKLVIDALRREGVAAELQPLLRAALGRLTPTRS
jgi:Holliday junction resolvasome RuvABC DNA-binding subunit